MTTPAARRDAQVIVVGAGPAGAATATLFAEQGLETMIVDRGRLPRPKICGEYLSPETTRILDRLGVLKAVDAGAAPLRGMRITAPDGTTLEGGYRAIGTWRPYRDHALAVSRAILDGALVDRLRVAPIDVREELRVTDLVLDGGRIVGIDGTDRDGRPLRLRADLVVGADGRASVVARRLGCRTAHPLQRMALVTYVTGVDGCREYGEIFIDPPDYAILNPVDEGRINLSVVVPLAHVAPYSDRLEAFFSARAALLPHLARRLAGAERLEGVRAMGPLAYRVRPSPRAGALLVGDAAGFYDPLTGEGVYAALRGAELLVEATAAPLRAGKITVDLGVAYETARGQAFAAKARVVELLQLVIRRRWLANVVAHRLAGRPEALAVLMGVIGDFVPPRALLPALLR